MKLNITVIAKRSGYYDKYAVDREVSIESDDPEAVHTFAANCGKAVEILATTAIEDRAEMLAQETAEETDNGN
jgi:hypothetical protein